ncbi:MAG: GTP-binding protein, partial [Alphaproteobacteria bacterium]|nr:GTP-binding protein [Alphaproteobacteria bacterium]
MTVLQDIISKRRTFAIISHPDAGKTTLTEKLLLFGGAIQMAGSVKAKKEKRAARSDWMKVEQERGISVSSSVMTFEYNGITYNLLDTPGHEDFSEDTYRVLTAVDSAIMVIDAAKGIETQTRKLFEVCRLRDIPIITFINKMDRDGKDSFELLEEIEKTLALDVCPRTWPIGMGRDFKGCYHLDKNVINFIGRQTDKSRLPDKIEKIDSLEDKKLETLLPSDQLQKLKDDITYVEALCPTFDEEAYLNGSLTPVYFGS